MGNKIRIAPLPAGLMLNSIIGIAISFIWIYPQSSAWGIGMGIIFGIMFVSSFVSMTYGPTQVEMSEYKDAKEIAEEKVIESIEKKVATKKRSKLKTPSKKSRKTKR